VTAVKKFYHHVGLDDISFDNEFKNLKECHHKNIVRLVGYCHHTQQIYSEEVEKFYKCERLLCFEYLPGGGLDKHISGTNGAVIRIP
jgi:serine/threonine protein kinase